MNCLKAYVMLSFAALTKSSQKTTLIVPVASDIRPSCLVTLPDLVKTFLEPNNFVSCPLMLTSWLDVLLARDEMVLFWVISLISKGWFVIDFTIVCFSMTTFVVPYFLFSPYFLIFTGDLLFAKLSNFSFCSGKKHTALTTLSAVCRLQSKYLYFWLAAFFTGETAWMKQSNSCFCAGCGDSGKIEMKWKDSVKYQVGIFACGKVERP